jgi:hypothetical protein
MNPTSIGGGRNALPRSVLDLFTPIELANYPTAEIRDIAVAMAFERGLLDIDGEEITRKCMSVGDLDLVLQLQDELQRRLSMGTLAFEGSWRGSGGVSSGSGAGAGSSDGAPPPARAWCSGGSVQDYNLRDTDQFLHVVQRNAAAHEAHVRIMVLGGRDVDGSGAASGAPAYNRREGLVPFVELVYAQRLPSAELQLAARSLIWDMFVSGAVATAAKGAPKPEEVSIDVLDSFVRVGSVYLTKPSDQGGAVGAPHKPLVHLPSTLRHLQSLAAAVNTGLPVLVGGGSCSGKTSIVRELARLCSQRLIEVNATHDTDVADLLGQWTLRNSSVAADHSSAKLRAVYTNLFRVVLFECIPRISSEHRRGLLDQLVDVNPSVLNAELQSSMDTLRWRERREADSGCITEDKEMRGASPGDGYDGESAAEVVRYWAVRASKRWGELLRAVVALNAGCKEIVEPLVTHLRSYMVQVRLEATTASSESSFGFVEAAFLRAIREGVWVLVDNCNNAPPEVLERLNSLLEADAELSLFEKGDDHVLRRGKPGKPFAGIADNWRVFFTADLKRQGNKLSNAFLNRVVLICLEPLDAGLSHTTVESHEVSTVLEQDLAGMPGAREATTALLNFHVRAKALLVTKQLLVPKTYTISFRTLQHAARMCRSAAMGPHRVDTCTAVFLGVVHAYLWPLSEPHERSKLYRLLAEVLELPALVNAPFSLQPHGTRSSEVERSEQELAQQVLQVVRSAVKLVLVSAPRTMGGPGAEMPCGDGGSLTVASLQAYFKAVLKPLLAYLVAQAETVPTGAGTDLESFPVGFGTPSLVTGPASGGVAVHACPAQRCLERWDAEVLAVDVSSPVVSPEAAAAVRGVCADTLKALFPGQDFSTSDRPLAVSQTALDTLKGLQAVRAHVLDHVRHTSFSDAHRRQGFLKGLLHIVKAAADGAADSKLVSISPGAALHGLPELVQAGRVALPDIAITAKAAWNTGRLLGGLTPTYLREPYDRIMLNIAARARCDDGSTYVFLGAYLQRCLRTCVVEGTQMLRHAVRFLLSASKPGTVPDPLRFGLMAELHIGHFRALLEQKSRQAEVAASRSCPEEAGAGAGAGAGVGASAHQAVSVPGLRLLERVMALVEEADRVLVAIGRLEDVKIPTLLSCQEANARRLQKEGDRLSQLKLDLHLLEELAELGKKSAHSGKSDSTLFSDRDKADMAKVRSEMKAVEERIVKAEEDGAATLAEIKELCLQFAEWQLKEEGSWGAAALARLEVEVEQDSRLAEVQLMASMAEAWRHLELPVSRGAAGVGEVPALVSVLRSVLLPAQWASESQLVLPFALFPPHRDVLDKSSELFNGDSVWFDVVDVDVKAGRPADPNADIGIGSIIGSMLASRVLFVMVVLAEPSSGTMSLLLLDLRAALRSKERGEAPTVFAVWYALDAARARLDEAQEASLAAVNRYLDAVEMCEGARVCALLTSGAVESGGGVGGMDAKPVGGGDLAGDGSSTVPSVKARNADPVFMARFSQGAVELPGGGNGGGNWGTGGSGGPWVPLLALVSRVGRTMAGSQGQLSLSITVSATFARTATHTALVQKKVTMRAVARPEDRAGAGAGARAGAGAGAGAGARAGAMGALDPNTVSMRASAGAVNSLRECTDWLWAVAKLVPTAVTGVELARAKNKAACVKLEMSSAAAALKASFIPPSHTGKRSTLKFLRLLLRRYPRLRIVRALEVAIELSDSGLASSDAQVGTVGLAGCLCVWVCVQEGGPVAHWYLCQCMHVLVRLLVRLLVRVGALENAVAFSNLTLTPGLHIISGCHRKPTATAGGRQAEPLSAQRPEVPCIP